MTEKLKTKGWKKDTSIYANKKGNKSNNVIKWIQGKTKLKGKKKVFHNDITIMNFYSANNLTSKFWEKSTPPCCFVYYSLIV